MSDWVVLDWGMSPKAADLRSCVRSIFGAIQVFLLVLLAATPCKGAIIYGVVNETLNDQTLDASPASFVFSIDGSNLIFNHDIGDINEATGQAYVDLDGIQIIGKNVGGFYYASNIAPGDLVGPTSNFISSPNTVDLALDAEFPADPNYEFAIPGVGFLGFQFDSNRYGWIRIEMLDTPTTPNLNSYRVVDFAYGGANESIVVGVPEPTSVFITSTVVSACGYRRYRRRRRQLTR